MSEKRLLLGDEALALGALHAGLSGVYAYPGTPSTEITEYIQHSPLAKERGVHSRWCTNEKTAMETALGMSYAGKRALVCMKHVGLNVCADPFINSASTGVNGGLVVLSADDPSMHSSQNEQDSRFYGKFAMVPILEPSNQQEAYDMMSVAFELSEALQLPVLMRLVTRLAHSRAAVEVRGEACPENPFNPDKDLSRWVLIPLNARRQYAKLVSLQDRIGCCSEDSPYNWLEGLDATPAATPAPIHPLGIIAAGIGYNYVKETAPAGIPILKISQYPLPEAKVKALAASCDKILVVEEGQPFVEENVRGILGAGYPIVCKLAGRRADQGELDATRMPLTGELIHGCLPRMGELTPDSVASALGVKCGPVFSPARNVAPRPPQLCQGCGHRDVFAALGFVANEFPDSRIFGDIGCYALGFLPPFRALESCVDMGSAITLAKGAADAGMFPVVTVIGDSTFTHSGMTGLLDAVNENSPITVIISDNFTTAMTGGQDSAGLNKYEAICLALGVEREHLHLVVPLPRNMEVITRIIREEMAYKGVSVIISQRECMQTLGRRMRAAKKTESK
ncbi:MAG: indolepyruvate ferredoxin oxidoreductase subunit alpha [Bacteroidales bacterium]|nr:indolepyruvate ferredoxin oxidoreductase subunit alpha [Bacteroidales bacterium]